MTILVCGLGRCGSSLTMQMLRAGGVKCYGDAPAFEPDDTGGDRDMRTLLPKLEGMAAKILDPQRSDWPQYPGLKVIWLDRDRKEQAKSQIKLIETFGEFTVPRRSQAIRAMAASFAGDRAECFGIFAGLGASLYVAQFEYILSNPRLFASEVAKFLSLPLDLGAMAAAVRPRSPLCAPDMAIEAELVEAAQTY